MKKSISLVLILLLTMLLFIPGNAIVPKTQQSFTTNALDLSEIQPYESPLSLCWIDERLYILGAYGVYQWRYDSGLTTLVDLSTSAQYQYSDRMPEEPDKAIAWASAIRFLFSDRQTLYGLHPYSGEIFEITGTVLKSVSHFPLEILIAKTEGGSFIREIKGVAFASQKLFVLLGTDDPNDYAKTQLISFDWNSHEVVECSPLDVSAIAEGGAGELMLFIEEGQKAIWQYNIASDTLRQQLTLIPQEETVSGLAWFSAKQSLLHYSSNRVFLTSSSESVQIKAYLPISYAGSETEAACSSNGIYAYPYGNHVFLRDVSFEGEAKQTLLRVLGSVHPKLLTEFSIENPEIAVVTLNTNVSEYLQQTAITSDSSVDLFVVSAPGDYAMIRKKGYAAPLNGDYELVLMAKELYPTIQDTIFCGDQLLAYPVSILLHSWAVNETRWEEFNLPDYPTTYDELFGLIFLWLNDYAEEYPDFTLSDFQQSPSDTLVTAIVNEYIFQNEKSGNTVTFDTPAFRSLMKSVIDNVALLSSENEQWGIPLISASYHDFGISNNDNDVVRMLLPPTLDSEKAQMLNGSLEVLVINNASKQQEEAIKFISYCAIHMDVKTQYSINPHFNEPVRNSSYQSRLDALNGELETLQNRFTNCDESEKAILRDLIKDKVLMIESVRKGKWSISPESIQVYRITAQNLHIPYDSNFLNKNDYGGFTAISQIINQYCANGLSLANLDAFIKDMDRITYMIYMENQ